MLDFTVISVGTIKEEFWRTAISEYVKRLTHLAKIRFQEVPEEHITSVTDRKNILEREGERITGLLPSDATIIALDRTGVSFTSTEWAEKLEAWAQFGKKLVFVIGGPLGLAATILKRATVIMSLSKMTFTHQMTRVILLEQLYRGCTILQGGKYHN